MPAETQGRAPHPSRKARASSARLAAVQFLYQTEFTGLTDDASLAEFVARRQEQDGQEDPPWVPPDDVLTRRIVRGTLGRVQDVDGIIDGALSAGRGLSQMEPLLRAMLRAGVFEMLANPETHGRIIIAEYLNLANAFFDGREPALVNAILDNVGAMLRPQELRGPDPEPR